MEKVLAYVDELDKELSKYPVLLNIDKQAGVPKAKTYAVLAAATLYFLLIFVNVAGGLLTNLLGFLYPAYASFKAIESKAKDDDVQWLTYWTVFGFLNTVEFFSDIVLYWLPLYYFIKAIVICYLALPQLRGAHFVYTTFLRPVLLQHFGQVDSIAAKVKKSAQDAVKDD